MSAERLDPVFRKVLPVPGRAEEEVDQEGVTMKPPDDCIECPHCHGATKCGCATCGVIDPAHKSVTFRDKGVCTVCRGLGFVPVPSR